jgi:GAF domain-containing protein
MTCTRNSGRREQEYLRPAGKARQMNISQSGDLRDLLTETYSSIEILARGLHVRNAEFQPTLDAIVTAAAARTPARDAGLILLAGQQVQPQASTGPVPLRLDGIQERAGEGPCIEAAQQQALVRIDDMRAEERWAQFTAAASEHGIGSVLCAPLRLDDRCLGTLTLYAPEPAAFGERDEADIALFATLAAIALAEAQRAEQLRAAIASRDLIGQAKGILMERYKISADAAFGVLTRTSQDENIKLAAVARQVAESGELPRAPA